MHRNQSYIYEKIDRTSQEITRCRHCDIQILSKDAVWTKHNAYCYKCAEKLGATK